jgi:hypothetical protein
MTTEATEFTRPATWDDLIVLGKALEQSGARYALIGSYALSAHGYQRFSEDIDILVDPTPDNTPRWVEALSTLPDGAAKELAGDPNIFEREGQYAIRVNDEITIDVIPAACGHGWQELSKHSIRIELAKGVSLSVLSLEGLLLTKESSRDKDKADRAVLLRALGRDA